MRLVLASASPRRRELLGFLGLPFDVAAADLDESVRQGEHALDESVRQGEHAFDYVERLAREKANAIADQRPDDVVLAADTSVVVDDHILGKPGADPAAGAAMLRKISGRIHQVMTGLAVARGDDVFSRVVVSDVHVRRLTEHEIGWYVATGEGHDKAGGYASQARFGLFISAISGSSSSVIGLPLAETVDLLRLAGFPLPWEPRP